MWRPKGWVNPHALVQRVIGETTDAVIFEEGAAAMLEALEKGGRIFDGEEAEWRRIGKIMRRAREVKNKQCKE